MTYVDLETKSSRDRAIQRSFSFSSGLRDLYQFPDEYICIKNNYLRL